MRVHLCPFACIMIFMSLGAFSSLSYVQGEKVEKVQWGLSDLTKTNYSLHFCAGALNGSDRPEWITTTKWERGRERGWKEVKEQERLKGKIQEEFFAFPPLGRSVCWWSAVCFSGKRISCLPPTQVSQTEWSPSGEFLNPAKVCVFLCSTHLLLIKQWQAVKMLFDRNCGN